MSDDRLPEVHLIAIAAPHAMWVEVDPEEFTEELHRVIAFNAYGTPFVAVGRSLMLAPDVFEGRTYRLRDGYKP